MRAGELRHILRLERRQEAQDGYGAPAETWAVEGRARGAVRPLGVVERAEAARKYGEVTHLVRLRGRHLKLSAAKRFVYEDPRVDADRILEIVGIMDYDERGRELRVMCKEAQ